MSSTNPDFHFIDIEIILVAETLLHGEQGLFHPIVDDMAADDLAM